MAQEEDKSNGLKRPLTLEQVFKIMTQFTKVLLVITIGLLTSDLTSVTANQFKKYGGNLKALCEGRQTDFRNVGDLRNLVYLLDDKEATAKCHSTTIDALRSFGEIVKDTKACSLEKAQALAQFYENFLRASKDVSESGKLSEDSFNKLPKPVIRFVLAYGMKVSSICRKYMINVFLKKAETELLTGDDFKELADWTSEKSPLSRLLGSLKRPDEIILPGDLSSLLPNGRAMAKFSFMTANSDKVERLKEVCTRRFKPVYKNVLIPLAVLANSGLTYNEMVFAMDLRLRSRVVPKIALWSKIVFLCESLDGIGVGQYQRDQLDATTAPLTLVLAEEANEEATPLETQSHDFGFKQVDTLYPDVRIKDEIMGQIDLRLKSLIKMFNTEKTYEERIRARLLGRGWSLLMARFKYGEFKNLIRGALTLVKRSLRRPDDQFLDKELEDLLDAKDETRLNKVLTGLNRGGRNLGRLYVVYLVRFVIASVIFILVASGLKSETVDSLNDMLKNY